MTMASAVGKAVVIIHGVHDNPDTLQFFRDYIKQKLPPGTDVYLIHILHGLPSLIPLWKQVEKFRVELERILLLHPQGIHLIGYSQGGLIARAIIETMEDHRVDTFISLTAPQMGQYGETMLQNICCYKFLLSTLNWFLYTRLGQFISLGNYWKNPYRLTDYLTACKFLPLLNNEINHDHSAEFKRNFLKIRRLVLIGGPNDTTITPWQSSQFGFFAKDDETIILQMRNQEIYSQDTFGLKTLDSRGALSVISVPWLDHQDFPNDKPFINQYIIPFLK